MITGPALDWKENLATLAPAFAERAAAYDDTDAFVAVCAGRCVLAGRNEYEPVTEEPTGRPLINVDLRPSRMTAPEWQAKLPFKARSFDVPLAPERIVG